MKVEFHCQLERRKKFQKELLINFNVKKKSWILLRESIKTRSVDNLTLYDLLLLPHCVYLSRCAQIYEVRVLITECTDRVT